MTASKALGEQGEEMGVRVLVLGPLPPPYGGPEIMTQALLEGLRISNDLVIKHLDTQVSRSLAEKGGKHQLRKSLLALLQCVGFLHVLFSFRPHLIYMPLTNSPSYLGFLRDCGFLLPSLMFGGKVVIRLHGGYYFYAHTRGLKRWLVRSILGRVSLAMVQGTRLTSVFDGLVPAERIVVVQNGLDGKGFACSPASREKRGSPSSSKKILFVGLLCKEKGFHDALAAIPLVPNGKFVFAGEWPSSLEEQQAREFVALHRIEDRVDFAGVVVGPSKCDLFASADVFVFPTYFVYEGHTVSSVEALAAGLPIVCTDHGALNESVRHGWNGYFISRENPEAIAFRLSELLNDDALRQLMGKRSRELYEARFTIETFISAWTRAIKNCLNGGVG